VDRPKIRNLEAIPARDDTICLRDPLGLSEKLLLIPVDLFFICTLLDGRHTVEDLQAAYMRRFGELLLSHRIREILARLDSCLFLDNPRFREARRRMIRTFRASAVRPAAHAGLSYEEQPELLRRQLAELFANPAGSGPQETEPRRPGKLKALIAPHIDIRRGGCCYAASYAELAKTSSASLFIVLGISHQEARRRYILTNKDFETPLGKMPVDKEFVAELASRCKTDFFTDEILHRQEHSIEFQVLFLQFLFRKRKDVRLVPVLCSSMQDFITSGTSPANDAEVGEFIAALDEAGKARGREVCYIAAADLSHLGARFGRQLSLSPELLAWLETQDRKMLGCVLERNAEAFFDLISQEGDRRNVCGVPALYTLLRVMGRGGSRLLRYGQAVDQAQESVVSYAGAAFYGGERRSSGAPGGE
jgi:AmmeMemoRadiSam system protein B